MNVKLGDCFKLLKKIPDCSVDCIITDPPYFLDKLSHEWDYTNKTNSNVIKNIPSCMKYKKEQSKNLEEYMYEFSKICFRILKPGGFLISFSAPRLYHGLATGIEKGGFEIRNQLCWKYKLSQGKAMSVKRFIGTLNISNRKKEKLLKKLKCLKTPQPRPLFEPICLAMKPTEGTFLENFVQYGTGLMNCSNGFPTTVIECPKPRGEEKKENGHPTVKPVELMKTLIDTYCPKKGLLIDPFLGSGTTAVACKILNKEKGSQRNFIGFERNKDYMKIIKKRLKSIK